MCPEPPKTAAPDGSVIVGIVLMCLGAICMVGLDASARMLLETYSLPQLVVLRCLFSISLIVAFTAGPFRACGAAHEAAGLACVPLLPDGRFDVRLLPCASAYSTGRCHRHRFRGAVDRHVIVAPVSGRTGRSVAMGGGYRWFRRCARRPSARFGSDASGRVHRPGWLGDVCQPVADGRANSVPPNPPRR